jgi:predicted phage tail protein
VSYKRTSDFWCECGALVYIALAGTAVLGVALLMDVGGRFEASSQTVFLVALGVALVVPGVFVAAMIAWSSRRYMRRLK